MPLTWLERGARKATHFPRWLKVTVAMGADAIAVALALLGALLLRRGSFEDALHVPPVIFPLAGLAFIFSLYVLGLYSAIFRFANHGGLAKAFLGATLASGLLAAINFGLMHAPLSGRGVIIFGVLSLVYMVVSRSLVRELFYFRRGAKERVVIYGAGVAGAQLARALRESGECLPVAFIDADPSLHGRTVASIRVFGPKALPSLIKRERISSVLLAIPSCTRRERQAILRSLEALPVSVRTVPDIRDILCGYATVADLREVDSSDLLGREPVMPNAALLDACIRDKVVLVSGAGGSIGSELCRQIVRLAPRRLVLLELSEAALYRIETELRQMLTSHKELEIVALLGNAMHHGRVRDLMHTYGVQTVYHAAAYKHVPIVEHNVVEGIHNNIFATWCMAEAALATQVETFVLISTDKAVNPTNVMGATKRFAELILQALQERSVETRFCMVRFGNVLDSSGSVVPLFREQIKRGGPVTVTHPQIIRYFMTIPEAAQLVLQAGAMAKGGDVFVLDMGQPVRIDDLARRMIHLMGLTVRDEADPDGDIEIVYTGLRPAEKLYEELLIGDNVTGTDHPRVMRATEHHLPWSQLRERLLELLDAVDAFDCERARELLMDTVAEYRPHSPIQDLVWRSKQHRVLDKVTELSSHRRAMRALAL